jgi:hypothetical protein
MSYSPQKWQADRTDAWSSATSRQSEQSIFSAHDIPNYSTALVQVLFAALGVRVLVIPKPKEQMQLSLQHGAVVNVELWCRLGCWCVFVPLLSRLHWQPTDCDSQIFFCDNRFALLQTPYTHHPGTDKVGVRHQI